MDVVRKVSVAAVALVAVCVFPLFPGVAVAGEPGSARAAGKVGAPIAS